MSGRKIPNLENKFALKEKAWSDSPSLLLMQLGVLKTFSSMKYLNLSKFTLSLIFSDCSPSLRFGLPGSWNHKL